SGGAVLVTGQLRVGHWPTESSVYNMTAGTLTLNAISAVNPFVTSGTAEQNGALYVGIDGTGTFNQSGGVVNAQALVLDNRADTAGTDTYNMTGGTLILGTWGIQAEPSTQVNFGGGTISAS